MKTTPQRNRDEELSRDTSDKLNDLIGEQVVHLLGPPDDLLTVQVRGVGSDRYRVNVVVGKDVMSGWIAHSYFLTADGEGNILTSSPDVARVY
jgi:hypothetical protein